MRILIVTNLYPPHYYGGYEVRCAQVAEALRSSGHDVRVLTSAYGVPLNPLGKIRRRRKELNGVPVHRVLNQYAYEPQPAHRPWTLFQAKRELSDVKEFVELVKSFQPHVIHRFVNAERRGSELYTYDLCRSLAGRHDVLCCTRLQRMPPGGWRASRSTGCRRSSSATRNRGRRRSFGGSRGRDPHVPGPGD
jgi:hypothetical protein